MFNQRAKPNDPDDDPERVTIHLILKEEDGVNTGPLDLADFEDELESFIEERDLGSLDGHEFGVETSQYILYLYGANADALWAAIEHRVKACPCFRSGFVVKGYSTKAAPHEVRIEL